MATPIVGITPLTAVFFLGFSVGKRLQQTHANEELRYGTKEENRFMLIIMLTIMLLTIIIYGNIHLQYMYIKLCHFYKFNIMILCKL